MTRSLSNAPVLPARVAALFAAASPTLAAWGGSDSPTAPPSPAPAPAAAALACDDGIKTAFKPDANTTVLKVKAFNAGDALQLDSAVASAGTTPVDVCLVKLLVGPGKAGPAAAPSASWSTRGSAATTRPRTLRLFAPASPASTAWSAPMRMRPSV